MINVTLEVKFSFNNCSQIFIELARSIDDWQEFLLTLH
jgi:hypothetical protein